MERIIIADKYTEYTADRYEALKNRIIRMHENQFRQPFENSRNKEASLTFIADLNGAYLSIAKDELFLDALEQFNRGYSLWFTVPEIIHSLEPILEKLKRQHEKSQVFSFSPLRKKVKKRFLLFGFIPTIPRVIEYYDENNALERTVTHKIEFTRPFIERLGKAKSKDEKELIWSEMFSIEIDQVSQPLNLTIIDGEPTMLKLFHAIVKYNAVFEFVEKLKQGEIWGVELSENENEVIVTEVKKSEELLSSRPEILKPIQKKGVAFRKKQAFAVHFLLEGMELLSPKRSAVIRLLEVLTGNDHIDPDNSQFKKLLKKVGPENYTQEEAEEVILLFEELNILGKNKALTKAIQSIRNDMNS